ncbi:MAG TPA: response regulator, partial [Ferruginibacter sp.]|nr:response regulator [Ferruginibacter sp.]
IMDMFLSGFNGIDACNDIKHDTQLSSIPLIMMSAHADAKNKCLAAGADDFIAKPFELAELLNKIEKNLGTVTHDDETKQIELNPKT